MFTLDVEFIGGDILHDWVQVETEPLEKAQEIMRTEPVISVAIRDEGRRLVQMIDWRDAS